MRWRALDCCIALTMGALADAAGFGNNGQKIKVNANMFQATFKKQGLLIQ